MKKYIILSLSALFISTLSHAKVWRVNNNVGVDADFALLTTALADVNVVNTDTIYLEPSATGYGSITLTKQLVIIGNGYLLDGTGNGNAGLQENINSSIVDQITLNAGSEGSHFMGLFFNQWLFFNQIASAANISAERCFFNTYIVLHSSGTKSFSNISVRKCFMNYTSTTYLFNANATLNNLMIENCIFRGYPDMSIDVASLNVSFRNNVVLGAITTNNAYIANNAFLFGSPSSFTSCVVKNNLFVANQTGVTVGPLSTNGNNLVSQTLASIIVNTGSDDAKYQLAAASPAIGGGVDIGGIKPDCGAFGGNDPYVLSGIPNIPTIYSLSFPNGNSIPAGSPTIEEDFSTRNNK